MLISIYNQSTLCDDADIMVITSAVAEQMGPVAQAWGKVNPSVVFGAAEADVLLVVLDDSDSAGALGYHGETPDGQPYARVFARDSIAGLMGIDPASLSGEQPSQLVLNAVAQVVSHEVIEAFVDLEANDWAEDNSGLEWALEACDPVESDVYTEDIGNNTVTLSNWVTPEFFDPEPPANANFDFLGNVSAPFTIDAGGYAIQQQGGQIQSVFGDALSDWREAEHKESIEDAVRGVDTARLASRTARRYRTHQTRADIAAQLTEKEPAVAKLPKDVAAQPKAGPGPADQPKAGQPAPSPQPKAAEPEQEGKLVMSRESVEAAPGVDQPKAPIEDRAPGDPGGVAQTRATAGDTVADSADESDYRDEEHILGRNDLSGLVDDSGHVYVDKILPHGEPGALMEGEPGEDAQWPEQKIRAERDAERAAQKERDEEKARLRALRGEADAMPEPTTVGHAVVQDNVSEPGIQITRQVDAAGSSVHESRHDARPLLARLRIVSQKPAAAADADPAQSDLRIVSQ